MEIKVRQKWESEEHPHENIEIYDEVYIYDNERIVFWQRTNKVAFDEFIAAKKGMSIKDLLAQGRNTHPYAWAGECSVSSLKNRIKKYSLELI